MKAYVLLGLVLAVPTMAQEPASPSVTDAAKLALATCSDHADQGLPIVSKNSKELAAKGLRYQLEAPEFLQPIKATSLGTGEFAKAPSATGEVWAVGYDSAGCIVVTLGAPVAEAEAGYVAYFTESKKWRSERVSGGKGGEKLLRYVWNPRRNLKLTADISIQEANSVTRVTITRSTK